jgi:cytoskeletal protein CcmA (bactofilin family)
MGIVRRKKAKSTKESGFTLIGDSCNIDGVINVRGKLVIDGSIEGTIKCETLVTGPSSKIKAQVNASNVTLRGFIEGDVYVQQHLNIASTGKLVGSVSYGTLSIEPGGKLDGKLSRLEAKDKKLIPLGKTIESV